MKKQYKVLSLLLVLAMVFSVVAFGGCFAFCEHVDEDPKDCYCDKCSATISPVDDNLDGKCDNCNASVNITATSLQATVTFAVDSGRRFLVDKIDEYIAQFNSVYPNIQIEVQSEYTYDELDQLCQTADAPNLVITSLTKIADYDTLPLDRYINATMPIVVNETSSIVMGMTEEQKSLFDTTLWNGSKDVDGNMKSLPFISSADVVYYNANALEIMYLSVATTWQELWEQCAVIKQKFPDCTPLVVESEYSLLYILCQQYGYDFLSIDEPNYLFNNPELQSLLVELKGYYNKGYFTTAGCLNFFVDGYFTRGYETGCVYALDRTENVSYYCGLSSSNSFEKGITTVFGLEQADGSVNDAFLLRPYNIAVIQKENNAQNVASWLFAKYLATNTQYFSQTSQIGRYLPAIDLGNVQLDVTIGDQKDKEQFTKAMQTLSDNISNGFVTPYFKGVYSVELQMRPLLAGVVRGEKTPAYALQQAIDNCINGSAE